MVNRKQLVGSFNGVKFFTVGKTKKQLTTLQGQIDDNLSADVIFNGLTSQMVFSQKRYNLLSKPKLLQYLNQKIAYNFDDCATMAHIGSFLIHCNLATKHDDTDSMITGSFYGDNFLLAFTASHTIVFNLSSKDNDDNKYDTVLLFGKYKKTRKDYCKVYQYALLDL